MCTDLAGEDPQRAPEIRGDASPFRAFLLPCGTLPHHPQWGQKRAPPWEAETAASPSTKAASRDSSVAPAAGYAPSTRIRAPGCEGTSGTARGAGIRTIIRNEEILARVTRSPPPPPPRCLVDVAVDPPFGPILVAVSEHQELWLSALLLRCATCPLWRDRDDT